MGAMEGGKGGSNTVVDFHTNKNSEGGKSKWRNPNLKVVCVRSLTG